jgi:signal transduction histidine kinase/CheY-like chemotaxis protein
MLSRWLRELPLAHKLTLLAALPCLVALLIPIPVILQHELATARSSAVADLQTTADSLGYASSAALSFRDQQGADRILRSLTANPHIIAAVLYDRLGKPVAAYARGPAEWRSLVVPPVRNESYNFGGDSLELFHVITFKDEPLGTLFLRSDMAELRARLISYILSGSAILLGALCCAVFLGRKLQTLISGPVTELRQRTAELAAKTQELETANRNLAVATEAALAASAAKSQFLANMSHEIRTPLNGVLGMAGLLHDTPLDRMQQDYVDTIERSGNHLLSVINDILDFSKIEAGRLELDEADTDLRGVLEEVAKECSRSARDKQLEVMVSIDHTLPERVRADATKLRQVMLNLCSNAIKFTAKGHIKIEVKVVSLDSESVVTEVSVHDTGIGVSEEVLQRLFKPFCQADGSTTRRYGGTGLGLSIVKSLAQLMGGDAGAESEPGKGSRFWFTARLSPLTAEQPQPLAFKPLLGQRVLIVDDNAVNVQILSEQLRRWGLECDTASSGPEALSLMQRARKPYDVAILDHQMPGMDGVELGRLINTSPDLQVTRLVMLSSSAQPQDRKMFEELGFAAYLDKPWNRGELIEALSVVLSCESSAWHSLTHPIVTPGLLREHRGNERRRILVAEDDPVNRKVAIGFLEKLGFRVDAVEDGRAAVEAWSQNRYQLILMDCQMPRLDGFAATQQIRSREQGTGRHIPIVALTANATREAQAECKEAGMDHYVSKPFKREQLQACLELCLAGDDLRGPAAHAGPVPVDLHKFTSCGVGDVGFQRDLLQLFIETNQPLLAELGQAASTDALPSIEEIRKLAHRVKGSSSAVCANEVAWAAERLESAAKRGESQLFRGLIAELRDRFEETAAFLESEIS